MADQPAAERTEQPTPRRLEKAREDGRVPQSQELAAAATLLSLLLSLAVLAPGLLRWCQSKLESGFAAGPVTAFSDTGEFLNLAHRCILDVMIVTAPILAALFVAALLASLVVGGLTFTPAALRLRWNALNPASALQNLVDKKSAVRLLASILKLFFVSIIVWLYLRDKLEVLAALRWAWSAAIVAATGQIILGLGVRVGIAILVIGLADALYQKWQYIQELKMTRQEVKQERKDLEGSPEIKSRVRRIQIEMSMRRLRQDVPKANVILVNPTHVAVALRYEAKTMEAPILLAKGADLLAERIVKIGRSYGVPIIQRPEVARAIYATVKPGQPIPEAMYMAVAEVLAMLYRLRQKKRGQATR
jgi:flagellar biosynthetic protein FlhB